MYLFTMPMNKVTLSKLKLSALAAAVAALALAATAAAGTSLSLVGYSTPKAVMGKIIQAWQQTPDGQGVSFSQSYGASTDQARAVAQGLKADVVFLSTGDDVNLPPVRGNGSTNSVLDSTRDQPKKFYRVLTVE